MNMIFGPHTQIAVVKNAYQADAAQRRGANPSSNTEVGIHTGLLPLRVRVDQLDFLQPLAEFVENLFAPIRSKDVEGH
jgi:hypothetical protein